MNQELPGVPPLRVVRGVKEFVAGLAKWFSGHRQLQNVAIRGELSNLNESMGGHLNFKLKEETTVLECVVWFNNRRGMPELQDGLSAICGGNLRIRADRSGYQLIVESVELVGVGELQQRFEQLRTRFRAEGLFDASRKRAVPELPRRVALISASGKAKQDFIETLERNVPFVDVVFIEAKVQGFGAEIDIADAIDVANRTNPDVIVLTRGGGSYEELFPFNLEPVVRAIVRSKVPVLTAIGHSSDHHLADDVADMRFGTPSLAAEHIAKGWMVAQRRLAVGARDLVRAMRDTIGRGHQQLDALARDVDRCAARTISAKRAALAASSQRLERLSPQRVVADMRGRVATASGRLAAAAVRLLSRKTHACGDGRTRFRHAAATYGALAARRLERALDALDALDPLGPLKRGYAIVTANGRAVTDAATVDLGSLVRARLARGTLSARVESRSDDE